MLKKVFRSMVALILVSGLVLSSSTVSAERGGTCSITIDESIHTDGVFAEPTGDCQGHIYGDYTANGIPAISGAVTRTVSHGEVVTFSIPRLGEYAMTVTLIPIEEAPTDPVEEVDKAELESKVSEVSNLNSEDYTTESWSSFVDALSGAETVLSNEDATQDEVDTALSGLTNAHDNLVEAEAPEDPVEEADKSELESKANEVSGLNSEDYTSESWSPFADALSGAETVLTNEDATQDEVDQALTDLINGQDNLIEVEEDPVEEPDKTSGSEEKESDKEKQNDEEQTTNEKDENSKTEEVNKEEESSDNKNVKNANGEEKQEGERLPDTATDNFNVLLIGLSIMLFGGLLYFFQSRRKQEQ